MKSTLVGYLRLVRFPLIFTAIADSWAYYLLASGTAGVDGWLLGKLAVCSGALLCFGMAFNDLLDYPKDIQLNPRRPLPAGQVATAEAALVVGGMLLVAGVVSFFNRPWMMLGAGLVAVLIALYNGLLKRWPAVGLLLLGLIRFHHAAIWHGGWGGRFIFQPWWLMNHVLLISVVAYRLEAKQPPLGRLGAWALAVLWVACNAVILLVAGWQEHGTVGLPSVPWAQLLWPAIACCAFVVIGTLVVFARRLRTDSARARWLMRVGLPWLIVYDAAFVASTNRWPWAIAIGGLAVLSVLSSVAIRAMQARVQKD
jgi:hypothetical protein